MGMAPKPKEEYEGNNAELALCKWNMDTYSMGW